MLEDLRERRYDLPPVLNLSGDWMIVGDVHCPLYSFIWIERVVQVGRKMKRPRQLLIAGDYLDMANFSLYEAITTVPTWAEEKKSGREVLQVLGEVFERIVFIEGNHERRLRRFTAAAFDESDWLGLLTAPPFKSKTDISITPRGYALIHTPTGVWRVTHPKSYSANRMAVANDLALRYNCHIISFHEHHIGITYDRYGRHVIVNGGCLVDPDLLAYVVMDDKRGGATMINGFVSLVEGIPTIYGPEPITSWK